MPSPRPAPATRPEQEPPRPSRSQQWRLAMVAGALNLPSRADLYAGTANPELSEQAGVLADALRGRDALVAFFDRPTQGGKRPSDRRLVTALRLRVIRRYDDGTLYRPSSD